MGIRVVYGLFNRTPEKNSNTSFVHIDLTGKNLKFTRILITYHKSVYKEKVQKTIIGNG